MAKVQLDPQYRLLTHFKLPLWRWPAAPLQRAMAEALPEGRLRNWLRAPIAMITARAV